jgi:hypothetical protein
MTEPSKIILNALRTPDGTVLVSRHRHDYQTYTDANGKTYMVDGGFDYLRRSAHDDSEDLSLYDTEPHEVQRKVIVWGSYGKNGDQPLTYKAVADMETEHIEAVLRECQPRDVIKACLETELKQREVKNDT